MPINQGLLKRNPSLTPQEFSESWYSRHAQLVVPFFLHSGVNHYEQVCLPLPPPHDKSHTHPQIHGPLHPISSTASASLLALITSYDGAAGMPAQEILDMPSQLPAWKQAYYDEVIKVDERRFLVSEALDHIHRVPPQSVKGER